MLTIQASAIDRTPIDTTPLDTLLARRHYFQLRTALQAPEYQSLPPVKKLYYEAFVKNFFHDLQASNKAIDRLLLHHRKEMTEKATVALLMKKIDNYVKLYQYREAYLTSRTLLTRFAKALNKEQADDVANSAIIWEGLQNTPPQSVTVERDTRIPYVRDIAGLINIPVQFADSSFQFIFDTGANLSVISESYAKKAGLTLLNKFFKVKAITGLEIDANLSVAKEFRIGDITIRNAVFMVFPDSALSLAGGRYVIRGIIGFPVIEQLQEVHIVKSSGDEKPSITVPKKPTHSSIGNFGMDELIPVINIGVNDDTLAFTFDTGAQTTILNAPYFRKYKKDIETNGKPITMHTGGAGGSVESAAYQLPVTRFTVSNETVSVPELSVKTATAESKDGFYFGNLGQDVMYQFKEMIINFKSMYVEFRR